MSTRRARTATNAERRAAPRKAQRATKGFAGWPWLAAGGVAFLAVAIVVGIRLASPGDGSEPGEPTSNAASGSGAGGELSQIKTNDFHSMAVSPADADVILYGHHGGVLRSTDGGRTWLTTTLTAEADDAMGMGISGAAPNVVYAAGHDTFFKSTDGGQKWESLNPDLPGRDIHGLAVAPDREGRLYANVVRYGFFRSDDGGETWTKANSGSFPGDVIQVSASADGVVYVASVQVGVLRSNDAGATFKGTGQLSGGVLTVAASATDLNIVYAGTESGLFASTDGGKTWQPRTVPGGGQVLVAAVNPADSLNVTLVAVQDDGAGHVFRSRDGGATWGAG